MDVVRTNIESIGGSIDIQSQPGLGTTMKVKIPLTLAIVPALMVTSNGHRFAIPQVHLVELLRLSDGRAAEAVEMIHNTPVYRRRGELLPLVSLKREFGQEDSLVESGSDVLNILVLQADDRRFGLVVEAVQNREEIVVKPLHRALTVLPQLAGATIMGDGRVALILDVIGLAHAAGLDPDQLDDAITEDVAGAQSEDGRRSMLVCELRSGRNVAIPLTEVDRLEDYPASAVEIADEREVVQYRDQIMPLVRLSDVFHDPEAAETSDRVKTVVVSNRGHRVGIVVKRIVDVLSADGPTRPSERHGAVGESTVIDGRVTDVLDVAAVVRAAGVIPPEQVL